MKVLLTCLLCLCYGASMSQEHPKIELENFWFVYFVRGENKETADDAARAKAMEGHLGNLNRLVDEGKAVAAGPFEGTQDRRGIVILKGDKFKTKEEVVKEFANDPFVKADRLRVEVRKWATTKGSVKKWKTPEEMKSYVFVVLDLGTERSPMSDKEGSELQTAHLKHIFAMKDSGELGIAGPFLEDGEMRGILIFKHKDIEKAKKLVEQDPLFKADRLRPTYLVLWMAAGIVGD
ncbi:MAG: hypothetical protein WD716_03035 [Fimbriimonadaceae bacterium]